MPERVAIHRIVVGGGGDDDKNRRVIEPGTRFNTEDYQIDAEQLEKYDRRRVTREPRDQQQDDSGPRANSRMGRVVEGRSGPARDVTNPMPGDNEGGRVLREPTDNRDMLRQGQGGQGAAPARPEAAPAAPEHAETRRSTRRSDSDL
jgi:hypothetical protein